ncbi:MAG: hypothetical protein JWO77_1478 [Ilumatobacteraceae bacterium]|nr:hypothetical protein [Ilumatobacteraceae bacterium]
MGFSFRVAPGVRVRASSRGVRASVGPRAARVHVGSGRTGVSTGAGPVSYYTSVGGGGRRRSAVGGPGPSRTSIAAQQRQMVKAQKQQEASELADAIAGLTSLHHAPFDPSTAPIVEPVAPPPLEQFEAEHRAVALEGVGFFQFADRRAAKAGAVESAAVAHGQAVFEANAVTQERQADADRWWSQVKDNDPESVLSLLEEAFEDNEVPAAAIGVNGDEVVLVAVVPSLDIVPERVPSVTDAGNLSLKKMAKRDRVAIYKEFVAGCLLVTLKEAFAVAPAIMSARVAALRDDGPDSYGKPDLVCLIAGRWARADLDGVIWSTDASRILNDTATELLLTQKGQAKELHPLDLSDEPDIVQLLQATDFS